MEIYGLFSLGPNTQILLIVHFLLIPNLLDTFYVSKLFLTYFKTFFFSLAHYLLR